jgi:hypothetical protein
MIIVAKATPTNVKKLLVNYLCLTTVGANEFAPKLPIALPSLLI